MKKIFLVFAGVFLFCINSICAQESEEISQVLLPLDVYVGDHAEIRYTFRSAVDFFPGEGETGRKSIKNPFTGLEKSFSVVKAELYRNEMEYTVRFVIVPWKTGSITFPSFDLTKMLEQKGQESENDPHFFIALYPIEVKSIVEKTGNNHIMPPVPPIIIPGTTYVIFAIVLASIIVLIIFFRFLLSFNQIRRRWLMYLKKHAQRKNAEDALKKIKRLLKNSKLSDIEFCSSLQTVTRNYLEFRFEYRFTAISSGNIRNAFEKICLGDIPSEIAYSVEDLSAMFIRTDYIRYAHDSIDSQLYPPQEHQAILVKTERKSLSEMVIKAINCFESESAMEEENEN